MKSKISTLVIAVAVACCFAVHPNHANAAKWKTVIPEYGFTTKSIASDIRSNGDAAIAYVTDGGDGVAIRVYNSKKKKWMTATEFTSTSPSSSKYTALGSVSRITITPLQSHWVATWTTSYYDPNDLDDIDDRTYVDTLNVAIVKRGGKKTKKQPTFADTIADPDEQFDPVVIPASTKHNNFHLNWSDENTHNRIQFWKAGSGFVNDSKKLTQGGPGDPITVNGKTHRFFINSGTTFKTLEFDPKEKEYFYGSRTLTLSGARKRAQVSGKDKTFSVYKASNGAYYSVLVNQDSEIEISNSLNLPDISNAQLVFNDYGKGQYIMMWTEFGDENSLNMQIFRPGNGWGEQQVLETYPSGGASFKFEHIRTYANGNVSGIWKQGSTWYIKTYESGTQSWSDTHVIDRSSASLSIKGLKHRHQVTNAQGNKDVEYMYHDATKKYSLRPITLESKGSFKAANKLVIPKGYKRFIVPTHPGYNYVGANTRASNYHLVLAVKGKRIRAIRGKETKLFQ